MTNIHSTAHFPFIPSGSSNVLPTQHPAGLFPDLPTTVVPLNHPSLIDFPVRTC